MCLNPDSLGVGLSKVWHDEEFDAGHERVQQRRHPAGLPATWTALRRYDCPSGLRATQYVLLTEVKTMDRPTLRDLAARLVMDLSALGHSLKPLIRDGFIDTRSRSERFARQARCIDQARRKKFEETARLWQAAQDRFEASFGRRVPLHCGLFLPRLRRMRSHGNTSRAPKARRTKLYKFFLPLP